MSGRHEANQPTARPTNKLIAAGLTGTVITIGLGILDTLSSSTFDGAWWGSAVATGCALVAGYLRRNQVS